MKINRNQALYKALPNSFTLYSPSNNSDYKFAVKVIGWNKKEVVGIYKDKIVNDIISRIKSFEKSEGDVSQFMRTDLFSLFEFCEAATNENFPDIMCEINPSLFYCIKCNKVTTLTKNSHSVPSCPNCKVKMKQLQMVYPCHCGYADGVSLPSNDQHYYKDEGRGRSAYKFYKLENGVKRIVEMYKKCPSCGNTLVPRNAIDNRVFYPQSGKTVNLFDSKLAQLLKDEKTNTFKLFLAKWINLVSEEEYNNVLKKPDNYFNPSEPDIKEEEIQKLMKQFGIDRTAVIAILSSANSAIDALSVHNKLTESIQIGSDLEEICSNLIEYHTLLNPPSVISLEQATIKSLENDKILEKDTLYKLNEKLGVKFSQTSEGVQIVNYSYAYTRLGMTQSDVTSGKILKLNPFQSGQKYSVYTSILDTEGILFEFDREKIYKFLVDNEIIEDDYIFDNESDIKKWFIEHVKLTNISKFSEIDESDIVTKMVYMLIHTISHIFIHSAGNNSGLSKDSLAELIFANVPSVFIYSTTIQGITLGALSGMFETNYAKFLEDAFEEYQTCTFDPICSTSQNSACVACCIVSDTSCEHFNKDLSRALLFGGEIKLSSNSESKIVIKKGFWK